MKILFIKALSLSSFALLLVVGNAKAIDLEREKLLNFADELTKDGEYYRAITEYRRFGSYFSDDPRVSQIDLRIAQCYLKGGRPLESLEWCKKIREKYPNDEVEQQAALTMGRGYLLLKNYTDAQSTFKGILKGVNSKAPYSDEAHYLLGISLVGDEKWKDASQEFSSVSLGSEYSERAKSYSPKALRGEKLPKKNSGLATVLSIVPGLGYIYTGNRGTGIASFVVNSIFGWGTYNAFRKKENGVGVVIGMFSLGFYTGNIYGGNISASRYNERVRSDFKSQFIW